MARKKSRQSIDMMIVVVLAPIWLVCLVLHLDLLRSERMAWFPLYVEPAATSDDFPSFRAYWPDVPVSSKTLRPGDRLLQFGELDLRGATRATVFESSYLTADRNHEIQALIERDQQELRVPIFLSARAFPWRTVPLTLGLGFAAFFALTRGQGRRSARAFALGALTYSFYWLLQFGGPVWQTRLGLLLFLGAGALFLPLTLGAALAIPERVSSLRERRPYWVWAFAVVIFFNLSWLLDWPFRGEIGVRLLVLTYLTFSILLFFILGRNYRAANAKGRRQLKWVILGFWIGLGPPVFGALVTAADPSLRWLYELSLIATPAIPICILIAITKDSFLDVDRLLTTTLVYSVLIPVGLGTFVTAGETLADQLAEVAGLDHTTALWIAIVLISGLIQPLSRIARPFLERIVARDQLRLRAALRNVVSEIRSERTPGGILSTAAKRLDELLELESCILYARAGSALHVVFTTGPFSPPTFHPDGSLLHSLATCDGSIQRSQWRTWLKRGALERVEAAALDSLSTQWIVPIRRQESIYAFMCIGEKKSGDAFSSAEIVLIDSIATQVGQQLDSYDREQLDEEARRLSENVAGYLPSAVVEEIQRGGEVELGELEVTILFVDIRGYSKLSATRSAKQVFELTNEYTTAVSSVIQRQSGVVVEFQGDGLMAVFGAPVALDDKEGAAVQAAHSILETMATRSFGDVPVGELSVGVGIATGAAFVGTIHAAGQKVWSAMGNTTNFASRLEGLTRNLDSAIVIDETTYDRATSADDAFERIDGVPIKGREDVVTVYALPLRVSGETSR